MVLNVYARPLIPLALSFIVGIVGALFLTGFESAVLVGLAAAFGFTVFCLIRRRNQRLLPLLIFLFLGYLSMQPWIAPRFPPHHIIHFAGLQKWHITGTVVSRPVLRSNRLNFLMTVERIEAAGISRSVTGRMRVTAIGTGCGFSNGDRISFESRIREPRNFSNPGGFDYKRHLAFQKVWATAYSPLESVTILSERPRSGIGHWIDWMRDRILELIDTTPVGEHRGVLAALILGERSRLAPETTASFQRVGIGHLLAISGLHIGIVTATVFFLLSRILSWIPWFLWHAGTRKWAAFGTFFPRAGLRFTGRHVSLHPKSVGYGRCFSADLSVRQGPGSFEHAGCCSDDTSRGLSAGFYFRLLSAVLCGRVCHHLRHGTVAADAAVALRTGDFAGLKKVYPLCSRVGMGYLGDPAADDVLFQPGLADRYSLKLPLRSDNRFRRRAVGPAGGFPAAGQFECRCGHNESVCGRSRPDTQAGGSDVAVALCGSSNRYPLPA